MKIAFIDVNYKNSSTGNLVYLLKRNFEFDNEVFVFYGRGKKVEEKNVFKFAFDFETFFHAFMARITGLNGYFSVLSTLRLLKLLKKIKPDVVHIHDIHGYFVNIEAIFSYLKKNNIKTVVTFHSEYLYTGKCGNTNGCNKYQTVCRNCPQLNSYPKSLYFDFTRFMFFRKKKIFENWPNLIITSPSEWIVKQTKKSFFKNNNVYLIRNFIDSSIFNSNKNTNVVFKKENHFFKILFVAPKLYSLQKGFNRLIEIAQNIENKNPLIKFYIVGEANIDIIKKCQKLSNVFLLGKIDSKISLAQYYFESDLYLITSLQETFSLTVLESLSCGTPVVGYFGGGIGEGIPSEMAKLFFYEQKERLFQLIANSTICEQYPEKEFISKYVTEKLSESNAISQFDALYKS
jgi:glycosyltransferase involved in cell wall biosynthesis